MLTRVGISKGLLWALKLLPLILLMFDFATKNKVFISMVNYQHAVKHLQN